MDNLGPSNAKVYDYLDYSYTQKLIKDHTSGKKNRRLLMWSFLSLETYLNIFFGKQNEK